jgi:hypothetical protein
MQWFGADILAHARRTYFFTIIIIIIEILYYIADIAEILKERHPYYVSPLCNHGYITLHITKVVKVQ